MILADVCMQLPWVLLTLLVLRQARLARPSLAVPFRVAAGISALAIAAELLTRTVATTASGGSPPILVMGGAIVMGSFLRALAVSVVLITILRHLLRLPVSPDDPAIGPPG